LRQKGYNPVGIDKNVGLFPLGTTDFTAMIEKWKESNVEIIFADATGGAFGTMWRQCHTLGFQPKLILASMAALFYLDVAAWGGDWPNAICCEMWWSPLFDCPGIGDTTPQSLTERWVEKTNQPLNPGIGYGYFPMQILFDAIERAGTLDGEEVNKAIGGTDIMTIDYRVKFNPEMHMSWLPLVLGQWQKTDKPELWEKQIVFSQHDFLPPTAEFLYPIPYK